MAKDKDKDNQIESLLKSYNGLKIKIDIKKENLYDMYPSCVSCGGDNLPHASGVSNQTANYAIKNATIKDYLLSSVGDAEKYIKTIEGIYGSLDSDCRDFTKYYFFDRNSKEEVKKTLFITDDVFGRRRRLILDHSIAILTDSGVDL